MTIKSLKASLYSLDSSDRQIYPLLDFYGGVSQQDFDCFPLLAN
jgi:hypothetical protein